MRYPTAMAGTITRKRATGAARPIAECPTIGWCSRGLAPLDMLESRRLSQAETPGVRGIRWEARVASDAANTTGGEHNRKGAGMILAYHSIFGMYVSGFPTIRVAPAPITSQVGSFPLRSGDEDRFAAERAIRPLPPNWQREAAGRVVLSAGLRNRRAALAIGAGFATAAGEGPYRIYACRSFPSTSTSCDRRQPAPHPCGGGPFEEPRDACFCGSWGLWDDERPLWAAHRLNVYREIHGSYNHFQPSPRTEVAQPPQRRAISGPTTELVILGVLPGSYPAINSRTASEPATATRLRLRRAWT